MPWTPEMRLQALMKLPWTVKSAPSEFGPYLTGAVLEINDAIAVGETARELAQALYASLRASLASRLEFDDEIALPDGCELPWANGAEPPVAEEDGTYSIALDLSAEGAWARPIIRSSGTSRTIQPQYATA